MHPSQTHRTLRPWCLWVCCDVCCLGGGWFSVVVLSRWFIFWGFTRPAQGIAWGCEWSLLGDGVVRCGPVLCLHAGPNCTTLNTCNGHGTCSPASNECTCTGVRACLCPCAALVRAAGTRHVFGPGHLRCMGNACRSLPPLSPPPPLLSPTLQIPAMHTCIPSS